jgi:hypothetical protein
MAKRRRRKPHNQRTTSAGASGAPSRRPTAVATLEGADDVPKPESAESSSDQRRAERVQRAIGLGVLALATLFVIWRLRPSLLFTNTLPAGGDLSLHDWGPDALRRAIFPQLSGWSWDWFDGFPAYQFYPVLPTAAAALLSYVLPYGVALKLVIVAGLVALPAVSYLFARWWRLPFPAAPLLALAAVAFLFDTSSVAGGTIISTTGGEFSYTFGLALSVLGLGLLGPVVREGRWRTAAAAALAGAALSHPLTGVFVVSGVVAVVAVHLGSDWRRLLRRVVPVAVVAAAISAGWWIPFVFQHGWMTDPNFPRVTGLHHLFPFGWAEPVLVVLMVAGLVLGWRAGRRIVGALALLSVLYALLFLVLPVGQFQNSRALPLWSWCRLSLAAVGVAEVALVVAARLTARAEPRRRWGERALLATPLVALVVVLTAVAVTWSIPPFGHDGESPGDHYIDVAMSGYQRNPQWPQYHALMDTMAAVGRTHGCGRLAWSVDIYTTDFGTVDNALAPYWTDGCITSLRGLFFDSSATTPFVGLTESLTSIAPEYFTAGLPYQSFDLALGVQNLQYAGVRYYAARTPPVVAAADAQADLVPIATSGPWHIYEVKGSSVAAPLRYQPTVLARGYDWTTSWIGYATEVAGWNDVVLTEDGPAAWDRVSPHETPPHRPLPAVTVRDVALSSNGLSFHVDRTGVPVLVKASYFPGWSAQGAEGPYRAAGNMMVVVPTAKTVTLSQGPGAVQWLADVVALAGLVGLVALFVIDRRRARRSSPSSAESS